MAQAKKKNGPRAKAKESTPNDAKRVVIYRRISTDEINQPHSLAAQEADCLRFIELHPGYVLVDNIKDSASGSSLNRPGFQKILAMAERREIDLIVFTKLDRLTRNMGDFQSLLDQLNKVDVGLATSDGELDTSSAQGRLLASLVVTIAQWERETINERIHRGIRSKAEKGLALHGRPPFGYGKDPATKGLVINEEEAKVVRLIFRYYRAGAGAGAIALKLNTKGLMKRGRPWDKPSVFRVLSCETLAGRIDYDGQILPAVHDKIIEEADFDKVQDLREARGDHRARALNRSNDYILSGLMKCGVCGKAYVGQSGTGRNGNARRYYTCVSRTKDVGSARCPNETVSAEALESAIIDLVLATYSDMGVFERAVEATKKLAPVQLGELELQQKNLSYTEEKLKRAMNRWLTAFEEGQLPPNAFQGRVNEIESELHGIYVEQARVSEEILMLLDSTPELVDIANHAELVTKALRQAGNADEKKQVLRGLVASLVVQPGRSIEPTLRVPSISDLSQAQVGDVDVVRTESSLVEVMGFEPTTSSLRTTRSAN